MRAVKFWRDEIGADGIRVDSANCMVLDKDCTSMNPEPGHLNEDASRFLQALSAYWKNSTPSSCFLQPGKEEKEERCVFPSNEQANSQPIRPIIFEMFPVNVFKNSTAPIVMPGSHDETVHSSSSSSSRRRNQNREEGREKDGYGADRFEQPQLAYNLFNSIKFLNDKPTDPLTPFDASTYLSSLALGCDDSGSHSMVYTESHDSISQPGTRVLLASSALSLAFPLLSCGTPRLFQGAELADARDFNFQRPPAMEWSLLVSHSHAYML